MAPCVIPWLPSNCAFSLVARQNSRAMVTAEASLSWLDGRVEALREAQDSIVATQARQSLYADRGRLEDTLKEGEEVLVSKVSC